MESLTTLFEMAERRQDEIDFDAIDVAAMKAGEESFDNDFEMDCLPDSWFN